MCPEQKDAPDPLPKNEAALKFRYLISNNTMSNGDFLTRAFDFIGRIYTRTKSEQETKRYILPI